MKCYYYVNTYNSFLQLDSLENVVSVSKSVSTSSLRTVCTSYPSISLANILKVDPTNLKKSLKNTINVHTTVPSGDSVVDQHGNFLLLIVVVEELLLRYLLSF